MTDLGDALVGLERRLRELERELAPGPRPVGAHATSAGAPEAVDGLVEELLRFRDELRRGTRTIEVALARLLDAVGAGDEQGEVTIHEGRCVVEAGPLDGVAAALALERGLAALPGRHEVRVRSFDGDRAVLDVRLAGPVALADELRRLVAGPVEVAVDEPGRLVLHLAPGAPAHPA